MMILDIGRLDSALCNKTLRVLFLKINFCKVLVKTTVSTAFLKWIELRIFDVRLEHVYVTNKFLKEIAIAIEYSQLINNWGQYYYFGHFAETIGFTVSSIYNYFGALVTLIFKSSRSLKFINYFVSDNAQSAQSVSATSEVVFDCISKCCPNLTSLRAPHCFLASDEWIVN